MQAVANTTLGDGLRYNSGMSTPNYVLPSEMLAAFPKPETDEQYHAVLNALLSEMRVLEARMEAREPAFVASSNAIAASHAVIASNLAWLKKSVDHVG